MGKIWANSGDSHLVEPRDLFASALPADLRRPNNQPAVNQPDPNTTTRTNQ